MIPIEDVFLTGLCATEQLKLNLTHNDVSAVPSVHRIDNVVYISYIQYPSLSISDNSGNNFDTTYV